MSPIEALMSEHRLIERMIRLMVKEVVVISETGRLDVAFVSATTDFLRTYADRCHHGKEEGILFRELSRKHLQEKDKTAMRGLIEDHIYARKTVTNLKRAADGHASDNLGSIDEASKLIKDLTELYPRHIEKEDKQFFRPSMEYFSAAEQQNMLQEFWDFDEKMIHNVYSKIVEDLEENAH
jgi:hemerythrin-like domain-containing protein